MRATIEEKRLAKQAEKQAALERIDALQQQFVELLLTGKSIAEAARRLRIGRRTATYWMQEDSLVRYAYEHERQKAATEFRERITKLHDLVLSALEDALSSETDPDVRISVAKFIYSSNLAQYGTLAPLPDAERLVNDVLTEAQNVAVFGLNDPGRIELVEDE